MERLIRVQWEAASALIAFAEGKKDEGLRLLRNAADHEDAIDKHPVTPGSLLPVREILADLLLGTGAAADALRQYEAVLKSAPRRFNATAGAARAAAEASDEFKPERTRCSFWRSARTPKFRDRVWLGRAGI